MQDSFNTKHKDLTIYLINLIKKLKNEKKSNTEIAMLLGKNCQTINKEFFNLKNRFKS